MKINIYEKRKKNKTNIINLNFLNFTKNLIEKKDEKITED